MIRRDYILQLIKRAGPALKKLFQLRQADKQQEAEEVLKAALREVLGLDMKLVLALSSKDLQSLLNMDPGQAMPKGLVIAELLTEYAETVEAHGRREEAAEIRGKAADFYRWVATLPGGREQVESSERAQRLLQG